jgi:phosphoinositide-3-kinase regulatory subunit 4
MVALETSHTEHVPVTLIEVWDIEKCMLVETFLMKTASASPEVVEEPQEVTGIDTEPSPAAAIAALVRSRQSGLTSATRIKKTHPSSSSGAQDDVFPAPSPTIRVIAVGLEFGGHHLGHRSETNDFANELNAHARSLGRGFMITGSEDRKIRLWDLGRLDRTAVFSGLESEHDKPSYRLVS